jgi:hypothetical protein
MTQILFEIFEEIEFEILSEGDFAVAHRDLGELETARRLLVNEMNENDVIVPSETSHVKLLDK